MNLAFVDRPRPTFSHDDIRRHSAPGSYPPICFDNEHFLISRKDWIALPDYSCTKPSGVYDGKCWKSLLGNEWWIGCYIEEDPPHPNGMLTPYRRALIVDDGDKVLPKT